VRLAQVAFVAIDLEPALERYSLSLGAGSWRIYTIGSAMHATVEYRGGPAEFSVLLALNDQTPQLEVIQQLEGDSIYCDWLDERRTGVHHLGYVVDSVARTTREMTAAGYQVIQAGSGLGVEGDGVYAYFDTLADLGVIVEAFEPPRRLPGPTSVRTVGTPTRSRP
jgi:methylmalonyl-CoA/ethylmalonyl-CoA epimerase